MRDVILRLQHFLTPRRLTYAYLAGGALWLGWLLSMLLGPGNRDLAGHLIGADFMAGYTGGKIVQLGRSPDLYDLSFQHTLQQSLVGGTWTDFEIFVNPPFYALLFVPLVHLPYLVSVALWMALSLAGLALSVRIWDSERPLRSSLWALTWLPVFATISYGQNALLSLTLFSLTYALWRRGRPVAAGLLCSLLAYKPQLLLGIGLLWLLNWRRDWRALLGLSLGGGVLGSLSFGLMPEASRAYVTFSREVLPGFIAWPGYPLWNMHTLRGFWLLLLPGRLPLVDALSLILSALGLWGFVRFWRRYRGNKALLFAGAICLTLWLTPHAMIYDWTLLLIPALVFWNEVPQWRERWRALYALVWLATFISGPLTYVQLQHFPVAVQLSVPVLAVVFYQAYRWLVVENSTFFLLSETN